MRVLYITAAHDQHIMSLGEFQACANRMYPQLRRCIIWECRLFASCSTCQWLMCGS